MHNVCRTRIINCQRQIITWELRSIILYYLSLELEAPEARDNSDHEAQNEQLLSWRLPDHHEVSSVCDQGSNLRVESDIMSSKVAELDNLDIKHFG